MNDINKLPLSPFMANLLVTRITEQSLSGGLQPPDGDWARVVREHNHRGTKRELCQFLSSYFSWYKTPEGAEFWSKVYDEIHDNDFCAIDESDYLELLLIGGLTTKYLS